MQAPNIFHYATKELSQDAFICWLGSWADPAYRMVDEALHRTGTMFVNRLLEVACLEKPAEYRSVRVRRQVKNIDVVLAVNELGKDKIAILIEDKVHSGEQGNQLSAYVGRLRKEFEDRIAPVYVKTGDQSNYDSVKKAEYALFLRKDFLEVLANGRALGVQNDVFAAFHEHLLAIECSVRSFVTTPPSDWDKWENEQSLQGNESMQRLLSGNRWKGFFMALQDRLRDPSAAWSYVANPAGGFMGFWWHGVQDKYLLLANDRLCFKIRSDPLQQVAKWHEWHNALMEIAKTGTNGMELERPRRRSPGQDMTVALMKGDYRKTNEKGFLDLDKTVEVLRNAESLMDAALKVSGS